jgi:hypothetical protein
VDLPKCFPFTHLRIPQGEQVLWNGHNPTFHRFLNYELVITRSAIYLCRRSWWRIARWTRISLDDVVDAELVGNHIRPGLKIQRAAGTISFHTPFDYYQDEMDFDRKILEQAIEIVRATKAGILLSERHLGE